jgi:solute carrier family 35 protein F5
LNGIQAILSTIAADEDPGAAGPSGGTSGKQRQDPDAMETEQQQNTRPKAPQKTGKIGEGKAMTLSKNQRKRVLCVASCLRVPLTLIFLRQTEQFRQPLIRSNPEFAKNPFATIRTHAQNTLTKQQAPN